MSNEQTGEKIKQKSYVFLLSIPHIPRHSAAKNLGRFMHKEKLMPVLHQIKSRSGSSGSTNKQNRTSALMAVNEGLKASETGENDTMEDDSTSRSFAEGVQDILEQNIKYITTPMWLPNLPPTVIKAMSGKIAGASATEGSNALDAKSKEGNERHGMIVVFTTQYVELLLKRLGQFGVGQQHGTISIFPTSLQRHAKTKRTASKNGKESPETQRGGLGSDPNANSENTEVDPTFVSEFVDSINSRVIVEEVIENVRSAAIFTFDYLMLVLVASMIAGVGLAVNSTVSIVASMLVSPIMGPILAITFGMTTKKHDLIMIGIRSELISLFLCILVGFIISLVFTAVGGPTAYEWPTPEMAGRGKPMAILESVFIALPST